MKINSIIIFTSTLLFLSCSDAGVKNGENNIQTADTSSAIQEASVSINKDFETFISSFQLLELPLTAPKNRNEFSLRSNDRMIKDGDLKYLGEKLHEFLLNDQGVIDSSIAIKKSYADYDYLSFYKYGKVIYKGENDIITLLYLMNTEDANGSVSNFIIAANYNKNGVLESGQVLAGESGTEVDAQKSSSITSNLKLESNKLCVEKNIVVTDNISNTSEKTRNVLCNSLVANQ